MSENWFGRKWDRQLNIQTHIYLLLQRDPDIDGSTCGVVSEAIRPRRSVAVGFVEGGRSREGAVAVASRAQDENATRRLAARERVRSSVRARCAIIGDEVVATKRRSREGNDADAANAGLVEELGET